MEPRIEPLRAPTEEAVEAFARLLPQLSSSAPAMSRDRLGDILASPATTVLIARADERIAGALTLVVFMIPTGMRAWIEDVIVDVDARGLGIGAALTNEAIRLAADAGAQTVDLTSRPSRAAANRLYERLGFERRETNVYRYTVGD